MSHLGRSAGCELYQVDVSCLLRDRRGWAPHLAGCCSLTPRPGSADLGSLLRSTERSPAGSGRWLLGQEKGLDICPHVLGS